MDSMRILFVCLGNICRSPAAEAVMREVLVSRMAPMKLEIDSAGTAAYHEGAEPDSRMRQALKARGYTKWSRARQVTPSDFQQFDLILALDHKNLADLKRLCPQPQLLSKLRLLGDFSLLHRGASVPDPYYGEAEDFERVIDMVEATLPQIQTWIQAQISSSDKDGRSS